MTWRERIASPEPFAGADVVQAESWCHCYVGENARDLLGEYGGRLGSPADQELERLGLAFADAVWSGRKDEAARIADATDARIAELRS